MTPVFTAEFDDGPMQGFQHVFVGAERPFADLYAMPHPGGEGRPYVIVGYSGFEPDPEHPWPGQVHYRLLATELLGEPVGRYVLAW